MKVIDVKTFAVDCFRTNWMFVKVYTDEGIDGVGEATLEYKEKALLGAVEHIKEVLVGQNPLDIEKHCLGFLFCFVFVFVCLFFFLVAVCLLSS